MQRHLKIAFCHVRSKRRRLRQPPPPSPLLRRQASVLLHPDPAALPFCANELFTGGDLLPLPILPPKPAGPWSHTRRPARQLPPGATPASRSCLCCQRARLPPAGARCGWGHRAPGLGHAMGPSDPAPRSAAAASDCPRARARRGRRPPRRDSPMPAAAAPYCPRRGSPRPAAVAPSSPRARAH